MTDPAGYICPVLHAHLPYVRHEEHEDFLEERWFFDALTECYIPLLRVFEGLEDDGVDYHILLSLSPPLVAMMEDELLQDRYRSHLQKLIRLSEQEIHRSRNDQHRGYLSKWYHNLLNQTLQWFERRCRGRVAMAFAGLASKGHVELMTCAATHGFLPLLRPNPAAVRAQVHTATDFHESVFGVRPAGMWIPECAYYDGLDRILDEAGIRYFMVDSHAIEHASSAPRHGVYAPVYCPSGVAAFGRDQESSKQVWSAEEGYPGHADYREFYRDLGHELPDECLREIMVDGKIRVNTGLKYYRITGQEGEKQLYDPARARERAAIDAGDFLHKRQEQVKRLRENMDRPPVAVAPYDAELFGHWWFEGPIFLDMLFRKMHFDQDVLGSITPAMVLKAMPTNQVATPAASSWGHNGTYEFWLDGSNEWIYPLLHKAADRFSILCAEELTLGSTPARTRAMKQAGRELLLAQCSDWPFIMRTGTSPDYAGKRVKDHLARFDALIEMLEEDAIDLGRLTAIEQLSPIFSNINLEYFIRPLTTA